MAKRFRFLRGRKAGKKWKATIIAVTALVLAVAFVIAVFVGVIGSLFSVIISAAGEIEADKGKEDGSGGAVGRAYNLSEYTLQFKEAMREACERYGMSEYFEVLMAIMEIESGSFSPEEWPDRMCCSESGYYTPEDPTDDYPGSIQDPLVSIDIGVQVFRDLVLNYGLALSPTGNPLASESALLALVQAYNYGPGFIEWLVTTGPYYGEFSLDAAKQYVVEMSGYEDGYGNWQYTERFKEHYMMDSSASTDPGELGDRSVIAGGMFSYPYSNPVHLWNTYPGHQGIDISWSGCYGQPIYCSADGTVVLTQTGLDTMQGSDGMESFGNCVFVDSGNGWQAVYAHMSRVAVANGDVVTAGQVLGYIGESGNAYGAHLHLALYYNGSAMDGDTAYAALAWPQYEDTGE